MKRAGLAIAAALGIANCAPTRLAYQPETFPGQMGYAEITLAENRYRISYTAPQRFGAVAIDPLARRRAAELALHRGFGWFHMLDRTVTRGVFVLPGQKGGRATYSDGYAEWRRFWHYYCLGQGWRGCDDDPLWPSSVAPVARVEVAYTVELLAEPHGYPDAIDAAALLATLTHRQAR